MADTDERSAIYQRVIDHCRPYRYTNLWSRLKVQCDLWELADTGQMLMDLEKEFGRAAIIDAGVAVQDHDGSLQFNRGGPEFSTILCPLRKEQGSNPFDLVTADGCLSGRLPVCAALEDARMRTAIRKAYDAILAVFSLADLAVLRLASLPVMLASGLPMLGGQALDEFCQAFRIRYENGRPRYPAKTSNLAGGSKRTTDQDKTDGASKTPVQDPLHRCDLVVVGWSPARLTTQNPEELNEFVAHFRRIEQHFRLALNNVYLWQPTPKDVEGITFCAKHGQRKDLRAALKNSIDESACELTWLPNQASVPKNLATTVALLQEATLDAADDRDTEARLWADYQGKINDELVRPLTEQAAASKEPAEKALLMAMAGISQLAHPHAMSIAAKVAKSLKKTTLSKVGPLPENELRQLLSMSDRIVALAKERGQCKWNQSKW